MARSSNWGSGPHKGGFRRSRWVAPKELADLLRADHGGRLDATREGMRRGAVRGVGMLKDRARAAGKVVTGQYVGGWRTVENGQGLLDGLDDAPHAGIVELGARPHKVSAEGIEAITRWAMLKLHLPESEARSAAYAIAKRIGERGQKGTYIVRDNLDRLADMARDEVADAMRRTFG